MPSHADHSYFTLKPRTSNVLLHKLYSLSACGRFCHAQFSARGLFLENVLRSETHEGDTVLELEAAAYSLVDFGAYSIETSPRIYCAAESTFRD